VICDIGDRLKDLNKLQKLDTIIEQLKNNSAVLTDLTTKNKVLTQEVSELKKANEQLSYELKKQQLIFVGLPDSNENPENTVLQFIENELGIRDVEIDTCYRMGKVDKNKSRPIKVRFVKQKDRNQIWHARLRLNKPYYVNEDLIYQTRWDRKIISNARAAAFREGKKTDVNWARKQITIDEISYEVINGVLEQTNKDGRTHAAMETNINDAFLEHQPPGEERSSRTELPKTRTDTEVNENLQTQH